MIALKCPKCGAPLVERVNGTTGEAFLGCERFPECRYTRPLPEDVVLRRSGQQDLPGFGE